MNLLVVTIVVLLGCIAGSLFWMSRIWVTNSSLRASLRPLSQEVKFAEKPNWMSKALTIFKESRDAGVMYSMRIENKPHSIYDDYALECAGEVRVPKRIYEGDSFNIAICLKRTFWMSSTAGKSLQFQDSKSGKDVIVRVLSHNRSEMFLEIELQAAALMIDGEKKQQQTLAAQPYTYNWNCLFSNSGNHMISFILRLRSPYGDTEIGTIEHRIRVVKLDHLTKRQVWLLASLAGILSSIFAVAKILHDIGVWYR